MRPEIVELAKTITPAAKPPRAIKRGRPKGSRNRPKVITAPVVQPAAYRIEDAARYLNVSVSTVRRLIRDQKLAAIAIGTVRLVSIKTLDRFLERGT
jgi:excisionase family DNA binding protein